MASASADDAAQETYIVAARRLADIEPGRERAFLFGVAARVASDFRRRQQRHDLKHEDVDTIAVAASDPSPECALDRAQAKRLLEAVLGTIPDEFRDVFVLYELEQLTMAEIGDALALAGGTVASRLRRGRELFEAEAQRVDARRARMEGQR